MNTGGISNISVIKFDTSFGSDASNDFTLPDYMPEIKRLLYVTASVLPEGKFLNGGALELDGTLSYNVVYAGDDGALSSAPLVAEYSADTALSAPANGTDGIFTDTQIESVTCRATGPRSLNIKSKLRFHVTGDDTVENDDTVLDKDGRVVSDSGLGIERLTEDISCVVRRRGSATESASGEMTAKDGAKAILCDGTLNVTGASVADGGVRVTGTVNVKCVFSVEDGYSRETCTIPFETVVPVESDGAMTDASAWGRVASVSVTPSDSDGGKFNVGVEYDLEAEASRSDGSSVCTDAYSTGYESDNEYRDLEVPEMIAFGVKRLEVEGSAELKVQSVDAVLLDVSPASCQSSLSIIDGELAAVGSVKVRALMNSDGEIFAQEVEMPLRVEIAEAPEGVSVQDIRGMVTCSPGDAAVKISGNSIEASCPVTVTYSLCKKRKVKMLSTVKLGESTSDGASPCIKVYYPEKDEDVWNVAKKYRADRVKLFKNNSFSGDTAEKGKPVIIV